MTDPIQNSPQQPDPNRPVAPRKKKKRWWLRILLTLLLLIVLVVAFAPMIASTGPVRSFVVGQVNNQLNGSVSIGDWSVGWTGGISASDIKVFDAQKQEVLSIAKFKTDLTLLNAAKQNFVLGDTVVTDLNLKKLVINEDGTTNLDTLVKKNGTTSSNPTPSNPSPSDQSSAPFKNPTQSADSQTKLPNVSGKITVDYQAHVEGAGLPATVNIPPSTAVINIADINQPITNDVKMNVQVGNGQPGSITLVGKSKVAEGNVLKIDTADVDQKLSISNVDLAALNAVLAKAGLKLEVGGTLGGDLALAAKGTKDVSANGQFAIVSMTAGGEMLKGDRFSSKNVAIPIKVAMTPTADGNDAQFKVDALGVKFDQGEVAVTANASQQTLLRASKSVPESLQGILARVSATTAPSDGSPADQQKAAASLRQYAAANTPVNTPATQPGEGTVSVDAHLDLAAIAGQLKNTLALQKGTELKSGRLTHHTLVTIHPNSVPVDTQTTIDQIAGTNAGKAVTLDPIVVKAGANALGLRDVTLNLASSFLTVDAKAPTLAQLQSQGKFDLAQIRKQLDPFVNIDEIVNGAGSQKKVALAGSGDFNVNTEGDPTAPNAVIKATAGLNLANIDVSGVKDFPPLKQSRTAVNVVVNAPMNNGAVTAIKDANLTVQAGEQASPMLDLAASVGDMDLKTYACKFALNKLNVPDLARVQQEFGPFVPALEKQGIKITSGQLATQVAGTYDGKFVTLDSPLKLQTPNLSITKTGPDGVVTPILTNENLRVSTAGKIGLVGGVSADLSDLSVTTSSNLFSLNKSNDSNLQVSVTPEGAVQGNGVVTLAADLKKLKSLGDAFATTRPAAGGAGGAGDLRSGQFDATVKLASSQQQGTTVNLDGGITKLSITTNDQPINNETVKLTLAAASKDLSVFDVNGQVQSSFVNTTISKTQVALNAGLWDMVTSAVIEVAAPDLKKLQNVLNAFSPPPAAEAVTAAATEEPVPPAGPLQITQGSAAAKINVSRDKAAKLTKLDVSEIRLSKLAMKRDARSYAFDQDVVLKLAAEVNAADDPSGKTTVAQQINNVKVTQLAGELNVATLSMPQPIVISGLSGTPQAAGAIKVQGTLDAATPLLAVLQGAEEMPYRGGYVLDQKVKSDGKLITLDGDLVATDFQVLNAKDRKVAFTEPKVTMKNLVDLDPAGRSVLIRTVDLAMPESQAVGLKLNGRFLDWQTKRQFAGFEQGKPMTLDLSYDLEKIWPIIYPTLTPEQQESYKDLKIAGKYTKRFNIAGGYAAVDKAGKVLAFNQAIKGMVVDGSFTVGRFEAMGLTIGETAVLDVPVYLKAGKLQTVFGDALSGKTDETKPPKPASCNGGELDLGGIVIDLSADVPRITLPKNKQIVRNISINPALGDSLGKFINPVFANSKRAEGRATVMVDYAEAVALGEKMKTAQSGRARIVFSLAQMDIANPFGSLLLGPIFSAFGNDAASTESDTFRGEIRNGEVTLDKGVTTQKISMSLKPTEKTAGGKTVVSNAASTPLTFDGNIDLTSLRQNLKVVVPPQLVSIPGVDVQALLPDGIPVVVKGTTTKSVVDYGNIIAKITQAKAEQEIRKALGGGKNNAKSGDGKSDGKSNDPLGGLLDQLGGKDKKKDDKKK